MKLKTDFVTNSSSTSFIIYNKTNKTKTIVDFALENKQLLKEFNERYCWSLDSGETMQDLLDSAKTRQIIFKPHEVKQCVFGDEQGDCIGRIYDYALRDGGSSKSFTWRLDKYLR